MADLDEQLFNLCSMRTGNVEAVKQLLQNPHINPNWSWSYGWTPLYNACYYRMTEVVDLLFNDERVDVNAMDGNGKTPLFLACSMGYIEIVENMLASRRKVSLNMGNRNESIVDLARERELKIEIDNWESVDEFQERKKIYQSITRLLESFEKDPVETRMKLRVKLGLAGKISFLFSIQIPFNSFLICK